MKNSKKNPSKADPSSAATQPSMPDSRWTLLFIGKRGRTIKLKRFKGLFLFNLLLLCVLIAIVAGLLLWNRSVLDEMHLLESDLKKLEERNETLRHEKDLLLTRLVVAESHVKEDRDNLSKKRIHEKEPYKGEQDTQFSEKSTPHGDTTAQIDVPERAHSEYDSDKPDSGLSVAIENFKLSVRSSNSSLRIRFKIKNTSLYSQYVSGHAIVVLEGKDVQHDQWVSIPGVPLVDGKPTGSRQGKAFGISNYKTMKFTASAPQFPGKYQTASVYIFTHNGELIFEQDFAVNLTDVSS